MVSSNVEVCATGDLVGVDAMASFHVAEDPDIGHDSTEENSLTIRKVRSASHRETVQGYGGYEEKAKSAQRLDDIRARLMRPDSSPKILSCLDSSVFSSIPSPQSVVHRAPSVSTFALTL